MKNKRLISLILSTCAFTALSSCSPVENVRKDISEYILETDYKEDYKILQLTDTHIANKDYQAEQFAFLNVVVKDANPDMIIVTGDLFTFADKQTAINLFNFLDSYNVPWTVTFGNHDEQCYFSVEWLTDYLNNFGSHCLFKDIQGDDVFGSANFAINLMQGTNIFEQVIVMDSNRYYYGTYFGYDFIKQDQIDWYERLVNYTTEKNNGEKVDSLLYFHIPFAEFQTAYDLYSEGSKAVSCVYMKENNEKVSCPKYNSGFFDKIVEMGSTKVCSVGHDHINNWAINYKGVILNYGVNSTDRIYYDSDLLGGQSIIIKKDHSLEFEHYYHTYAEVR